MSCMAAEHDTNEARSLAATLLVRAGCIMEDECVALLLAPKAESFPADLTARIEHLSQVAADLAALAAGAAALMRSDSD
jgi:hypothetical protein